PARSFFTSSPSPRSSPLSLHDALPICCLRPRLHSRAGDRRVHEPVGLPRAGVLRGGVVVRELHRRVVLSPRVAAAGEARRAAGEDRKSTRLNSSHVKISYAVFCLKKKK